MAGGQQINVGQGTLTPPRSYGQVASIVVGSIAAVSITLALVGQSIAAGQGSVIGTGSSTGTSDLVGQSVTVQQQSVVQSVDLPLSGIESASGQGSLVQSHLHPALTSTTIQAQSGVVSAAGQDVTVNISGAEVTLDPGSVSSGTTFLSGAASTSESGTTSPSISLSISGIQCDCNQGSISPAQEADDTYTQSYQGSVIGSLDVALAGSAVTTGQGAVAVTGDSIAELTGQALTVSAGSVGYDRAFPLTGSSITAAQQSMGAPGGAALTGSEVSVVAGEVFTTNDRTFALTGQQIAVQDGIAVTSYLAFATGQVLSVGQQEIGPRGATLIGELIISGSGLVRGPEQAVGTTYTGGYSTKKRHRLAAPRLLTDEEIRKQREELGILPKRAQTVIRKIVDKATQTDDPQQAAILAAAYTQDKQQDRLESRVKTAVSDAGLKWRGNMAEIAHALILGELQRKADEEMLAELMAAEEQERSEASEILQMWMNL